MTRPLTPGPTPPPQHPALLAIVAATAGCLTLGAGLPPVEVPEAPGTHAHVRPSPSPSMRPTPRPPGPPTVGTVQKPDGPILIPEIPHTVGTMVNPNDDPIPSPDPSPTPTPEAKP
ncbi:MAG: hypothetical protein JWM80_4171 [Cyanobacteria bacterium RYN_339]|nr:hypothetical protein [Cyanobacteria bacterium RYN_339]